MLSVRTRESNATTVTLMLLDVCPRRKRIPRDNLAEAAHPYSTLSFARSRRGRGTAKQLVVRWEASLRTDDVDSMVRRVRERLLSRFPAVAVAPHGARGSTITLASNGKTLAAREGWAMTPDAAIIQVQRGCPVQRGVYAADVESISRNSGELSVVVRHTPAEWYGRGSCGVALPVVTAHDLCVSAAAGGGVPCVPGARCVHAGTGPLRATHSTAARGHCWPSCRATVRACAVDGNQPRHAQLGSLVHGWRRVVCAHVE